MPIIDPPPAPEGGSSARPADLLNKPTILRPTGMGRWGEESKTPGKEYVVVDAWTLDRAGVVDHHESMWLGWWKAVAQLRENMGALVACRPTQQADNSIELVPLSGAAREVAESAAEAIAASFTVDTDVADMMVDDDLTEPF